MIADRTVSPYSNDAIFNCAIISPNPEVAEGCARELKKSIHVGAIDCLADYPTDEAMARMIRLNSMELLVIDCADLPRATEIVKLVHGHNPHIEILVICQEDVKILSTLMRAGVRNYVRTDAVLAELREMLAEAIENLLQKLISLDSFGPT